jgi:glycosyltransferase involved in cell wall biosynthesis
MQIIVEGWRFLPHSYAIANQFQLLEMSDRPELTIFHRDQPYASKTWQPVRNLFDPEAELTIEQIPNPEPDQQADATLRMYAPLNLAPANTPKTAVFGCTEWGILTKSILRGMGVSSLGEAHANTDTIIVTPSQRSREGFIRSGADGDRVVVVPLGVNPRIYHPLPPAERTILRQRLGIDSYFTFLNVGLMCDESQGVGRLLKAFATICDRHPDARLILKGRDALFPSKDSIAKAGQNNLTDAELDKIKSRLIYVGETLSFAQLAQLYQAADAYVSPYLAEGFNLPVLEAAACGLPVICTKGGPTDDFVNPQFALTIDSKLETGTTTEGDRVWFVVPEQDCLTELMEALIERPALSDRARRAGPAWVGQHFTWAKVVDRLLDVLGPSTVKLTRPSFEPIIL